MNAVLRSTEAAAVSPTAAVGHANPLRASEFGAEARSWSGDGREFIPRIVLSSDASLRPGS